MRSRGFSLIEMVVGLAVLGVLAVAIIPLIQMPATAYMEARNRTELQGQADLIQSKLEEDLRSAIPGSLRSKLVGGVWYVEFLQARASGRYRSADGGTSTCPAAPAAANKAGLATNTPDTCFTTVGDLAGSTPVANTDRVVIDTLEIPDAPYQTGALDRKALITSYTTPQASPPIRQFNIAAHTFPPAATPMTSRPWPANRFYVIQQAVSYVCSPGAGTLVRRWGYALQVVQPTAFGASSTALLSNRITTCKLPVQATTRGGVLNGQIELSGSVASLPAESQQLWLQVPVEEQW